jgi:hypothetical protein
MPKTYLTAKNSRMIMLKNQPIARIELSESNLNPAAPSSS